MIKSVGSSAIAQNLRVYGGAATLDDILVTHLPGLVADARDSLHLSESAIRSTRSPLETLGSLDLVR